MSRQVAAATRGRQPYLSSTRRTKESLDQTYSQKQRRGGSKLEATLRKKKQGGKTSKNVSDVESTADEDSSADDLDDDDDDDDDEDTDDDNKDDEEPEFLAPSRSAKLKAETGRYQYDQSDDNLSEAGEPYDFDVQDFDDHGAVERDEDLEKRLFDSDDDQLYEGVNEVSDSDDDDRAIRRVETDMLIEEFEIGEASNLINDIDGLSAYGFGNESDESMQFPLSPHGSEETLEHMNRRVRFEESVAYQRAALTSLSESPTMTRALLPSAMPDSFGNTLVETNRDATSNHSQDDGYDTDATDQLPIPSQAFEINPRAAKADSQDEEISAADAKEKTPGRPPPVAGKFDDDGSKVAAFLDSTGRKLLLSDPQGVFARICGPSAPASPSVGFEEAVFGESDSSQASMSPRITDNQDPTGTEPVDVMLSGLNSGVYESSNGQATGFPEAFVAPELKTAHSADFIPSDFFQFPAEESDELELNLEDMITFGNDTDDDSPTSPIYMPDDLELLNNRSGLAHLNNMNVTAFRRNADPSFAAQAYHASALRNTTFATPPRPTRKRKAENESPYAHSHYEGVTPVQRITERVDSSSPVPTSIRPSKRRRTMNF